MISVSPLVERAARVLYAKSLKRDGWVDPDSNEKWEHAKLRFSEDPDLYTRPKHALEDAAEVLSVLLEAMVEPTEAQLDAALASTNQRLDLPGSQMTVNREKARIRYRAMILALKKEVFKDMRT